MGTLAGADPSLKITFTTPSQDTGARTKEEVKAQSTPVLNRDLRFGRASTRCSIIGQALLTSGALRHPIADRASPSRRP